MTQEIFNAAWAYMPYLIPTIFLFSVIAFSDLLITLLVSIIKKTRSVINFRW